MIYRGTTPTLQFQIPFLAEDIDLLWVTFSQGSGTPPKEILTKTQSDAGIEITDNLVNVTLSQEETLLFAKVGTPSVSVQIRLKTTEGSAEASNIIKFPVGIILKEGVIE